MEIDVNENDKHSILLTNDYSPNHAMINEFQTLFFSCKMRRIELCSSSMNGFEVPQDARFMKLHLTITNLTNEILSMYREDFHILFDDHGPYEPEEYFHAEKQLPDEYALKPMERIMGCLVFIIPRNTTRITFTYTEYFDDESEGKTYRLKYKVN